MPPSRRSRAVSDLSDPSLDSGWTVSHDRVFKSRLHRFPTSVLRIGCVPRPARLCWLEALSHIPWPVQFMCTCGLEKPVPVARPLPVRTTLGCRAVARRNTDTPVHLTPSMDATRHPCLGRSRAQSTQCHEHACLSRKSCVTQFVHRFGMGGVAHWLGSNIADGGFTCTRYSAVIGEFGEPAQKISIEPVLLRNQLLFVGSNANFLEVSLSSH